MKEKHLDLNTVTENDGFDIKVLFFISSPFHPFNFYPMLMDIDRGLTWYYERPFRISEYKIYIDLALNMGSFVFYLLFSLEYK